MKYHYLQIYKGQPNKLGENSGTVSAWFQSGVEYKISIKQLSNCNNENE